jgi:hypothetical protein
MTNMLIGPLLANINKILLLKSLITVSFFQHNFYMFCHKISALKTHKTCPIKNDTQQKYEEKQILSHFPSKPHLK